VLGDTRVEEKKKEASLKTVKKDFPLQPFNRKEN